MTTIIDVVFFPGIFGEKELPPPPYVTYTRGKLLIWSPARRANAVKDFHIENTENQPCAGFITLLLRSEFSFRSNGNAATEKQNALAVKGFEKKNY